MSTGGLGLAGIVRLGLVQAALGAIVVLATSTMNRVMVVEWALPAALPGALIAFHYAMQVLRPRLGHGSDIGGRRTPWIVGGMATLAVGGVLASFATAWMGARPVPAIALAILAFGLIGLGVGAAGTSLLVLLAKRVDADRRAVAATIVWVMMIGGFALTAGLAGHLLDPFSPTRLVAVTAGVSCASFLVALVAVWGVEGHAPREPVTSAATAAGTSFRVALAQVWAEPPARRLAIFIFVSMLAYGGQDLILDPFAGSVFGFTPGQSTRLSGLQHGGVLLGMVLVPLVSWVIGRPHTAALRAWTIGGCVASACVLAGLAIGGLVGNTWPLGATVFVLGVANGVYAIAAISAMMALVAAGRASREGVRMGLWGAAQAIAFGLGGFLGSVASDVARHALGTPATAYAVVFGCEAALFLAAAFLAARIGAPSAPRAETPRTSRREALATGASPT